MKKFCFVLTFVLMLMLMAGCQKSNNKPAREEETTIPNTEAQTTVEYKIPEGAAGPGAVKIENNHMDLPEDKRPGETSASWDVLYYYVNSKGLNSEFDSIPGTECTPEALIELMVNDAVLADGTEIVSYQNEDGNAVLVLNRLDGVSSYATDENLSQALANTFIDNLGIDTLTVQAGDTAYGPLGFEKLKK